MIQYVCLLGSFNLPYPLEIARSHFSCSGKPTEKSVERVVQWLLPGRMPEGALVPVDGRRRVKIETWRAEYNELRLHSSPDNQTLREYEDLVKLRKRKTLVMNVLYFR
jgi:hypothetical protein